jgi:hypothetical protein
MKGERHARVLALTPCARRAGWTERGRRESGPDDSPAFTSRLVPSSSPRSGEGPARSTTVLDVLQCFRCFMFSLDSTIDSQALKTRPAYGATHKPKML